LRFISEKQALEKLRVLKDDFAGRIRSDFEKNAKSCVTCETPGACCLDAHFVNVRISRLEAKAIVRILDDLPEGKRERVYNRIERAIAEYRLDPDHDNTYACPLFEKGIGCLVHSDAKPLPCIQHACYENENDLPPDELLAEQEGRVDELNRRVYGTSGILSPLPIAVKLAEQSSQTFPAFDDECDNQAGNEPPA
jgi:hypothetical protein